MTSVESRVEEAMSGFVESGYIPGFAATVRVGRDTIDVAGGVRSLRTRQPMTADVVVRAASTSKIFGGVITLALVEEGVIALDQPARTWLPELSGLEVLRRPDGPLTDTEPLDTPITVRHLLTMTAGIGMPMHAGPIESAMDDLELDHPFSTDELVRRLTTIPLQFQPGGGWRYGWSASLLSILTERATSTSLDQLVERYVSRPLGLDHVATFCREPRRAAEVYDVDPTGELVPARHGTALAPSPDATFAGSLHTTTRDLVSLLDDIGSSRPRTLSAASATAMRTPQLDGQALTDLEEFLCPGMSWGYMVGVNVAPDAPIGGRTRFGWSGSTGVDAGRDPEADITAAVFILRTMMQAPYENPAIEAFWKAVYG
jgi:CubicO group peptidase (beta-lactamase class C family)